MRLETLTVHAGHNVDESFGALASPIALSVTFERDPEGVYPGGYYYSSKDNPKRNALESAFALLESGEAAVAFASGCAAITAVLRTLRPDDHILVPDGTCSRARSGFCGKSFPHGGSAIPLST